jgi:hypothetical protein
MAMTDGPILSDEAVRELLETRAGRAGIDGQLAAVRSAAAATPQHPGGRLRFGLGRGPAAGAAGLASLGVLAVVLAIMSGGRLSGPATGSGPSGAISSGPTGGPPATPVAPGAAEPVLPLTVAQLNALMATSRLLAGRQLVITGTIETDLTADFCFKPCTGRYLAGSSPRLWVDPGLAQGSPPWRTSLTITGTFAAVLNDQLVLEYQGAVSLAPDGSAWLPSQLPNPTPATLASGDWLVHAWIIGSLAAPACPASSVAVAPDGSQYGCGSPTSLTDASTPWTATSSSSAPLIGMRVQNDAYAAFALGFDGSNPAPEQATFLVRTVFTGGCGSCVITPADSHWEIVARIDPWPLPALP